MFLNLKMKQPCFEKKHILIVNSLNYAKNHFAHVTDAVRSILFRIGRFLMENNCKFDIP